MVQRAAKGNVAFDVTCAPAAKEQFNRAMAFYPSFAWDHAITAFKEVSLQAPAAVKAALHDRIR